MFVEIITPDQKVYEGETISATFPGSDGSFQVLKNHAPLISSLEKGSVVIKTDSGEENYTITGGVVEVLDNKVIVLAEGLLE